MSNHTNTVTIPAMFVPYILDALIVAGAHDKAKMFEAEEAGNAEAADYYAAQVTYYVDAFRAVDAARG